MTRLTFNPGERLVVPYAEFRNPLSGGLHARGAYTLEFSNRLTHLPMSYNEMVEYIEDLKKNKRLSKNVFVSTAADELAIQLNEKRNGRDPRKAGAFYDLLSQEGPKYMQLTDSVLEVPEEFQGGKIVRIEAVNYFPRTLVNHGKYSYPSFVEAQGFLNEVPDDKPIEDVWNEVTGLPKRIAIKTKTPHHTHAYLINKQASQDDKTVVISRSIELIHKTKSRCIAIMAIDPNQKEKYHAVRLVRKIVEGKNA